MNTPKIIDDDEGEISAVLDGEQIRSWIYRGDAARIQKMREAREFANGWIEARNRIAARDAATAPLVETIAAE